MLWWYTILNQPSVQKSSCILLALCLYASPALGNTRKCRYDLGSSSAVFICRSRACMLESRSISESESRRMMWVSTIACFWCLVGVESALFMFVLGRLRSPQSVQSRSKRSQVLVCAAIVLVPCRGIALCDDSDGSGSMLLQVVSPELACLCPGPSQSLNFVDNLPESGALGRLTILLVETDRDLGRIQTNVAVSCCYHQLRHVL